MLNGVFKNLDNWMTEEVKAALKDGLLPIKECEFKIVGQTALLEAALNLNLAATADVDAYTNAQYVVKAKLNEMLKAVGLELDPLSDEIWMPRETKYIPFFKGDLVRASRADPVHVLVSKAHKAPAKNRILIASYIAGEPPAEFFTLCKSYKVDLAAILRS